MCANEVIQIPVNYLQQLTGSIAHLTSMATQQQTQLNQLHTKLTDIVSSKNTECTNGVGPLVHIAHPFGMPTDSMSIYE